MNDEHSNMCAWAFKFQTPRTAYTSPLQPNTFYLDCYRIGKYSKSIQASMPSEASGVDKQESATSIVSQAAPEAPSLSTRPLQAPSANANERAGLSQSGCVLTAMTADFGLWRL